MPEPIELTVMCWDHPRCTDPTRAAAEAYRAVAPHVRVRQRVRPLAAFNDQPPWELDGDVDLVYVDHPMVGAIAERRALLPLTDLLSPLELTRLTAHAVPVALESYRWDDELWAVPVDVATHVSAAHEQRLAALGATRPRTWVEVLELAQAHPGAVDLASTGADLLCALISLTADAAGTRTPREPVAAAVDFLVRLVDTIGRDRLGQAPPALLDELADPTARLAYVPWLFGYALAHRHPVSLGDVPGRGPRATGAILGGAGLGVMAGSAHPREAAAFAAWLATPEVERDLLVPAGGQPGGRHLWPLEHVTASSGTADFFEATAGCLATASTRPRDPWWPGFHREAGEAVLAELRAGADADRVAALLDDLLARHRAEVAS